ncbi:uroporphyrinogen-III synthase [Alteribacillus persepolensis]|uniref:Uroporphyrinogen-III synthase n=1 Tax=Alteribacillus persepolensis TaxID=568899 RepID=A0A1G8BRY1_9BACI|nr:uroporphyrinogen-III synthase [Alteribacillus persepolensis]SDH35879.1 uroporphyrinogen-III synthase [Alteribacillus persepolensis]
MSLPLTGYSVLVTRPLRQASYFAKRIEEKGGTASVLPLIHTVRLQTAWEQYHNVLQSALFDWIVFTSANAVRYFQTWLRECKHDITGQARIAAVGKKTANVLRREGYSIEVVPDKFDAESLARVLVNHVKPGERVLFPKSARARNVIPPVLRQQGAEVTDMPLYTSEPFYENKPLLMQKIQEKQLHVLTFTSPSTVEAFCEFVQDIDRSLWESIPVICIGPVTEKEAMKQGFTQVDVAKSYTVEGMLQALLDRK